MCLSPSPVFAQSYVGVDHDARLLSRGQQEFTGSVRIVYGSLPGVRLGNAYAGSVFFGIAHRFDLGLSFARLQGAGGGGATFVSITPAIGVSGRTALLIPVSFALQSPAPQGWHVDPTLAVTLPVSGRADFDLSVRAIVPLCVGCQGGTLLGVEIGVGLHSRGGAVNIRPAFGFLVHPGDRGAIWVFGCVASFRTTKS